MNFENINGADGLDSIGKLVNYSNYSSSGISTVASLQSCDTSLFGDQFCSISEAESVGRSIHDSREFAFLEKVKCENSLNKASSSGIGGNEKQINNNISYPGNFQGNLGIKVLYRCDNSDHLDKNVNKEKLSGTTGLPMSIRSGESCVITVNDRKVRVIPSIKLCKDTFPIPTHFKNSDELVNYYTGKVLRSSDSLYYIEKKLQQALYGAVFLAYELNKIELSSSFEFNLSDPSSFPIDSTDEDEKICFRYDRKKDRIAIKISSMSLKKRKPTLKEDIEAEVLYSNKMKGHKNVLEYSEIWQDSFKNIYIKMEYAEYEDLFEVMKKRRKPLTENEARWLFTHIFSAVTYLHSNLMAMRDLSLENVLMFNREPNFFGFSDDMNVHGIIRPGDTIMYPKITDPGQACEIKSEKKDIVVSNLWKVHVINPRDSGYQLQKVEFLFGKSFRPPEAYSIGSYYDPTKVDVFCLGWMLLYTLTKYQPFETCRLVTDNINDKKYNNEGFINNIFGKIIGNNNKNSPLGEKKYVPKDENWSYIYNGRVYDLFRKIKATRLSPEVLHLIENMLNPNFKERFSMNNVLEHPWLSNSSLKSNSVLSPIMSSTILVPQKQVVHKHKQVNNIVKPSVFFEKIDGIGVNNNKGPKKSDVGTNNQSSNNNLPLDNTGSKNTKLVSNFITNKGKESSQIINNERLNSMIKRTNDKLKVTRISLPSSVSLSPSSSSFSKKDQDIEIIAKMLDKNCINKDHSEFKTHDQTKILSDNKKHPNEISQQTINDLNKCHIEIGKMNKKKVFLLSQMKSSGINSKKSIHIKKKSEHYFISDLWSFISGSNTN
ncbi:hypothetical protein RS030_6863 [Cryptosporidium xiaoi]|uniref:Protein kinase domain-containing protein n=1 Tax=Cryptosporidium xiaoi TaxID=659607 RepID=A0AAV9XWR5_9CRYT